MTASLRFRASLLIAVICLVLPSDPAGAQGASASSANRMATRAELESAAAQLEQVAASTVSSDRSRSTAREQAAVIRGRLSTGDFRTGDRIAVRIEGQLAVNDTLTVLTGPRISVPGFRQVSLQGVLRSELEEKLRVEVTDVVRDATVTARPLMRLAVFGSVGRPGYFSVPTETTLDDLLMRANGPLPDAAVAKMVLSRGDAVIVPAAGVSQAVAEGRTVNDLNLVDGDALVVPKGKLPWGRTDVLQIAGLFLTPILTIFVVKR